MHHPTHKITHTTAFVTPVVEHWLEPEVLLVDLSKQSNISLASVSMLLVDLSKQSNISLASVSMLLVDLSKQSYIRQDIGQYVTGGLK